MRRRTARPGQPPLPARVRQLHQLRPALHDHRLAALRPRRNHDGRLRDVRRMRPRVHRPHRPTVPRPARLLPELRTDAALPRRRRPRDRGRSGAATGTTAAARRRRARGQGHRRIPPGLRRRRRTRGRRTTQTQAPRRQAVRRHGPRLDDGARRRRRRQIIGACAVRTATPDRAHATACRRPDRRCGRAAQPRPRHHAGLHAAARSAVRVAGR